MQKTKVKMFDFLNDPFREGATDEKIDQFFAALALRPKKTFRIITSEAERMQKYISDPTCAGNVWCEMDCGDGLDFFGQSNGTPCQPKWPLSNVWLGVSAENQEKADARIPWLLKTPAALRFVSLEPLLGPITIPTMICERCGECQPDSFECRKCERPTMALPARLGWAIIGGESGRGARPCNVEWIRSLVRQCRDSGMPCFVKQFGKSYHTTTPGGSLTRVFSNDQKGGDILEWPEDMRVREFPLLQAERKPNDPA